MLETPLGKIQIRIDGERIAYEAYELDCGRSCENLNGRYYIQIHFVPDGKEHEISCSIIGHKVSDRDDIESGERIELKSFYNEDCKLSIGMEGDSVQTWYGADPTLMEI